MLVLSAPSMRVLLIDHEDSYTHNLAHLIAACVGELPQIVRHDDPEVLAFAANAQAIVLSPGPGTPLHTRDAGQSLALIRTTDKPLLGVCLGHQLIACAHGAQIVPALTPTHGYTSPILHDGTGLFAGMSAGFAAMRYHSLAVRDLPETLRATAHTPDGEIMALAHAHKLQLGVQFHPESIATPEGRTLLANFFAMARVRRRAAPKRATPIAERVPTALPAHPWSEPHTAFAQYFLHQPNAFLLDGTGRYAYAGFGPREEGWPSVTHAQPRNELPFASGVVGLLAYDSHPHRFIRPHAMLIFDRETQQAWRVGDLPAAQDVPGRGSGRTALASCSASDYASAIARCQEAIRAGEAYELCLTRQIHGTTTLAAWDIYQALRETNPAPFSAFFKFETHALVAASPELFLRVSGSVAETSPIKGTRARGATSEEDGALASDLATNAKDRAENLMIVDVARHDLGGVCDSVTVTELCAVKNFSTVHQLVSTVRGVLRPAVTASDAARALFPPASMTGAPKARACEWLAQIEDAPRGYYAGAYGWFSDSGDCELAVTIRSLWLDEERVTFGVGGAILLASDATSEWQETESKAAASMRALGASQ